jgi:dinuclear metal center YbgI/SA1388 family protein
MVMPKISDIAGIINKFAPVALAETWDNPGLQVGDPTASVERIMVALDPCRTAMEAAVSFGCSLLVTHHPLIFNPLKRISSQDTIGSLLTFAIKNSLSIVSAHTNYDVADGGLNDLLAERLGLCAVEPLKAGPPEKLVKLAVFVPIGHEEAVRNALLPYLINLGNYAECSFQTAGTGTFKPLAGATPFAGEVGKREYADEVRLEFLVRENDMNGALRALRKAHPYEEPAFDLYPLLNKGRQGGIGRIGELPASCTLAQFAATVKVLLGAPGVRMVGAGERLIRKVAVCGGSGAFLLHEAGFKGADVLVTGDIKYHEARDAEALGLAAIDAGHYSTEAIAIGGIAEKLEKGLAARGFAAEVLTFEGEREPFVFL